MGRWFGDLLRQHKIINIATWKFFIIGTSSLQKFRERKIVANFE
jgi:hypothetical protein